MDRIELTRQLSAFVATAAHDGLPVDVARLDDAIPGVLTGQYIVRLVAPWARGRSFTEALQPLVEVLFRTTDAATRASIAALDVYPSAAEIITPAQVQATWAS